MATPRLVLGDLVPDAALTVNDHDAFDHHAIADRLAELACTAQAPLNIALFGAWGSGKSSVFAQMQQRAQQLDPDAAVVPYDAWKYGGNTLKRHFVRSVAEYLGLADRRFLETLTQDRESSRLHLTGWLRRNAGQIAWGFVLSLLLSAALWLLTSWAQMLAQEIAYVEALRRELGRSTSAWLLLLGALLLGPKALESASVRVRAPAPSDDDEFGRQFKALLEALRGRRVRFARFRPSGSLPRRRLIVFIDELDRCAPGDVVGTLTDLKTFLDHDDCVFVVAADREVLEESLRRELRQTTPVREDEPYYSTPGAFLDKIFQHQPALPPLRTHALSRFANDLVRNAGGVWQELRDAEPENRLFDDVIFALIPAHVRSPTQGQDLAEQLRHGCPRPAGPRH